MEIKKNKYNMYQCPCCKHYTFQVKPDNTFQDCPVCGWEDDGVQLENLDYKGGANDVSLNEARKNFILFGVSDLRYKDLIRPPEEKELNN